MILGTIVHFRHVGIFPHNLLLSENVFIRRSNIWFLDYFGGCIKFRVNGGRIWMIQNPGNKGRIESGSPRGFFKRCKACRRGKSIPCFFFLPSLLFLFSLQKRRPKTLILFTGFIPCYPGILRDLTFSVYPAVT